jgi:hypothetical protein
MTITPFQMYWLVMLDSLSSVFIGTGIVIAIPLAILVIVYLVYLTEDKIKIVNSKLFFLWILPFVFVVIGNLIPSTKQMAAILIIPKIVNNQKVQEIPNKLLTLAEEWMDELRPTKDKK